VRSDIRVEVLEGSGEWRVLSSDLANSIINALTAFNNGQHSNHIIVGLPEQPVLVDLKDYRVGGRTFRCCLPE
jgi:hypothetical protein